MKDHNDTEAEASVDPTDGTELVLPAPENIEAEAITVIEVDGDEETVEEVEYTSVFNFTDTPPGGSALEALRASQPAPVETTTEEEYVPGQKTKGVKTYWGLTAIFGSWLIFFAAQIIFAIGLVIYTLYASPEIVSQLNQGTGVDDATAIFATMPLFLIIGQLSMYLCWWGSAWWVTAYRSGVQLGKKFTEAWKNNFFWRIKWIDLLIGVITAAVLFGLNLLILNGLPAVFPDLDMTGASNTQVFESLEGTIWFFIIAFGFGGLIGPISEELFFRGFMMKGLIHHFGYAKATRNIDDLEAEAGKQLGVEASSALTLFRSWTNRWKEVLALIITSVVFGFMHFQGGETFGQWLVVIITGLFGLIFGLITLKTKRIGAAMVGHVLYNSSAFVMLSLGIG